MRITQRLFALCDEGYADFQAKLTPTVPRESFIGVRVPVLRKLAREYLKEEEAALLLQLLPHTYFDENMLHALLLSEMRDYDACVRGVDAFLPFVDNWAVCDTLSPRVFRKHHQELLGEIRRWVASPHAYTCRFGMGMLMTHFLDDDFRPEYLALPASVRSDAYYVRMMIAWFFATALTKQWDATIPYIEEGRLDAWSHHKTIRKACESYRITPEQKEYLKGLQARASERSAMDAYM